MTGPSWTNIVGADQRKSMGSIAEEQAAVYLAERGYQIMERNVSFRVGELDIVAMDGETLVFVEVRSRTHPDQVHPAATVTRRKQGQIIRAAKAYCQDRNIRDTMIRFDVVAVLGTGGEIELFQNAFETVR
jgi:putative endonuclease